MHARTIATHVAATRLHGGAPVHHACADGPTGSAHTLGTQEDGAEPQTCSRHLWPLQRFIGADSCEVFQTGQHASTGGRKACQQGSAQ
jgi:hypothetical protein